MRHLQQFGPLADRYDGFILDLWGVIHDGITGFPDACNALETFRKQGGIVILITNAPRPADSVQPGL